MIRPYIKMMFFLLGKQRKWDLPKLRWGELATDGAAKQSAESQNALTTLTGCPPELESNTNCGKERLRPERGKNFTTEECVGTVLFVGPLSCERIDLGGTLKLTLSLKKLRIGEDTGMKKCTILALADGSEWISQGQPKSSPSRQRIDALSGSLRLEEYVGAEQAVGNTEGAFAQTAQDVRSICRDAMTAHHERGYQALGMFLVPAIWEYLAIEVAALGIQNGAEISPHVYPACPTADESMIFLVSRNGHSMWGKPTSSTSATNWRG